MRLEEKNITNEINKFISELIRKNISLNEIYVIDIERRKNIETQTLHSLDSNYISHTDTFITYELYLEYAINRDKKIIKDTYVIKNLKTLEELKKIYIYCITKLKTDFSFYNKSL